MRLGGPVFDCADDARSLADYHKRFGFSAAYAPRIDDVAKLAELRAWVVLLDAGDNSQMRSCPTNGAFQAQKMSRRAPSDRACDTVYTPCTCSYVEPELSPASDRTCAVRKGDRLARSRLTATPLPLT